MKCPSCGAETQNKICEFCGSEMPQEKATINITNNFYGEAAQQNNADSSVGKCPKCGSTKINFKREKMASNTRIKIGLKCSESGDINYTTTKNSKKTTDKIELKKYCPRLKKHTVHKETKLK